MDATRARIALIAGAATPVGRSISEGLADEGAHLLLTDLVAPHLDEVVQAIAARTGSRPEQRLLRVTDPEQWASAIEAAEVHFGRLDLVVNAAEFDPGMPWREATSEDWARAVDINVMGVVRGITAAIPALTRSGGTFVVVAGGPAAPSQPLRATARSAALTFARAIRGELAPDVTIATAVVAAGAEPGSGSRIMADLDAGVTSSTVESRLV